MNAMELHVLAQIKADMKALVDVTNKALDRVSELTEQLGTEKKRSSDLATKDEANRKRIRELELTRERMGQEIRVSRVRRSRLNNQC